MSLQIKCDCCGVVHDYQPRIGAMEFTEPGWLRYCGVVTFSEDSMRQSESTAAFYSCPDCNSTMSVAEIVEAFGDIIWAALDQGGVARK